MKMKTQALLLSCLLPLLAINFAYAAPSAAFSYSTIDANCSYVYIFSDKSTGSPVKWSWSFGDGTNSSAQNPFHIYFSTGTYNIMLAVEDAAGNKDTALQMLVVKAPASAFSYQPVDTLCSDVKVNFVNQTPSAIAYVWSLGDGQFYYGATPPDHNYKAPGEYDISLYALSATGCPMQSTKTLKLGTPAAIVPSVQPVSFTANYECTDEDGWTNYYYNNNTPNQSSDDKLLLSIFKNNNDIGAVNDGSFVLTVAATAGAGSNTGVLVTNPLITNTSGFWAMNRYWNVHPTKQPLTPVNVRFYFNTQDLNDVNGSYPLHNLSFKDLLLYKCIDGNPDPTSNLNGVSRIISIENGNTADTVHWVDKALLNGVHSAEFKVLSFSGGGAGATGNKKTLPVTLILFTAEKKDKNFVYFNWQTATEINTDRFEIESSTDGRTFKSFASVKASGNSSTAKSYTYNIQQNATSPVIYYRLKIIDKDGKSNLSKIIVINFGADKYIVHITPNPVSTGVAKVSLQESYTGKVAAWIYNINGTRVKQTEKYLQNENSFAVNVSNLPAGLYKVLIYKNEEKSAVVSLVISR